ncbi:hypothetical protein [Actinocorallia lasiicapitis]
MSEHVPPTERPGPGFADAMWSVPSYLLSGMAIWGGAGWLMSQWTGWLLFKPVGLIIGAGLSIYLVFVKFGR